MRPANVPVSRPSTRRGSTVLAALAAILGLALCAGDANGQQRRLAVEDSVMPIALFEAFSEGLFRRPAAAGENRVFVERIPVGIEARLPSIPGARTLGMVSGPSLEVIVQEADAPTDSIDALIRRGLPTRGWKSPAHSPSSGGFVRQRDSATYWCGSSSMLRYDVRAKNGGRARIAYWMSQEDLGACSQRGPRTREELPVLYNPEEVESFPTACAQSGGSSGNSTFGMVGSRLTPAQMMDHYARQLADSGWRPAPETGEGAIVRRTWRRTSPDGDRYVTITVSIPKGAPGCRILEMQSERKTSR